MNMDVVAAIAGMIGAALALVVSYLGFRSARKEQRANLPTGSESLQQTLNALAENAMTSSNLFREAEAQIRARVVAVEDLEKQAAQAEERAAVSRVASEAVTNLFREAVHEEVKASDRINLRWSAFFFLAGCAFSFFLTLVF